MMLETLYSQRREIVRTLDKALSERIMNKARNKFARAYHEKRLNRINAAIKAIETS